MCFSTGVPTNKWVQGESPLMGSDPSCRGAATHSFRWSASELPRVRANMSNSSSRRPEVSRDCRPALTLLEPRSAGTEGHVRLGPLPSHVLWPSCSKLGPGLVLGGQHGGRCTQGRAHEQGGRGTMGMATAHLE